MNSVAKSYRPARPVQLAKRALSFAEGLLPAHWYRALNGFVFSAYREGLRFFYLRFWLRHALAGNAQGREKAAIVFRVMPYSLVGWRGLEATFQVVCTVRRLGVQGSIVECGVAQGGSAALMALAESRAASRRKIWLFDSYEGLPDPTDEDFQGNRTGTHVRPLPKGSCLGTYEQVAELLFSNLGLSREDVRMVKGWFQDTLPVSRKEIGSIAILRIDADWYQSVKCCLENLYDSVVPGGYVIIDDYASCFGAEKAVNEFLSSRNLSVDLVPDGRGGCHFSKPG